MLQQLIALALIAVFIWRLSEQKRKKKIGQNEFIFWLSFWLLGVVAIVLIKQIDRLVGSLGFSSGINFLLYLAIIILFYMVFKLRLTLAKMDSNLTSIVRKIALLENSNLDSKSEDQHK
ncbi:MAG TPA: DUF2304 domain-containing protein [Candidatus Saccharimonadales bacterium]|nr:DUF2304 domain-containing protein [Candidatus Saccharimonadales bacterium]